MVKWPPDYTTDYTVQLLSSPIYSVHPVFGYFNNFLG